MAHTFLHDMDDQRVMIECGDEKTWVELTEIYFNYLQACGYVLTREQFAEEVNSMYGEL